jgi:tRNA pseudouridine55 synthase
VLDGVLLLDKPVGLSSNHALQRAKRALDAQKAGHTGTLDPFATGLLVCCMGRATKISGAMLSADKGYLATIAFGQETDSGDLTGVVVNQADEGFAGITQEALAEVLQTFLGTQMQIPPMISALKRDGKPLYEYARAGVELERAPRDITIHQIRWTDICWPEATLEVSCSKGTYIRVLAEDLGHALGCGAHLVGLRRTEVGHLSLEHSFTIESIQQGLQDSASYILPIDALLQTLPHLTVDEQQAKRLEMGQRVPLNLPSIEALVRIYRATAAPHNFIGTADWRSGVLHPKRLISQAH